MERNRYVYTLAYPESMGGQVFYVGKGTGNRIDFHEMEARNCTRNGKSSAKCDVIHRIWESGEQVQKCKVYEDLSDEEALVLEERTMRSYGFKNLTNLGFTRKENHLLKFIPSQVALTMDLREEITQGIEECLREENIELTRSNCYSYLQQLCEQAIRDRLSLRTTREELNLG